MSWNKNNFEDCIQNLDNQNIQWGIAEPEKIYLGPSLTSRDIKIPAAVHLCN